MIDFIFGDACSGKSSYIYDWITREAIEHPELKYYLMVPEQNTLKVQRELIAKSPRHGMLNLDVLSFQLLAYRVMDELGVEKPVMIDDVSKSILLRRAANEQADKLKVYRSKIDSDGFISRMKSIISELCQYDVSPERLREAEAGAEMPLLKGKLSDIAIIYESFKAMLKDRAAIPEDLAYMLLSIIERSGLLEGAVIVFDGFTGFTPVQERLLEHIIPRASRCRFAVTIPMSAAPYARGVKVGKATEIVEASYDAHNIDKVKSSTDSNTVGNAASSTVRQSSIIKTEKPDKTCKDQYQQGNNTDIYTLSRETVARVCRIAELNNIPNAGEIEIPYKRKAPAVSIVKAPDIVEEVRFAARQLRINALTRDLRYKRMAIAVTDTGAYTELIREELTREGVPFFIDDRQPATGSPAVGFIRAVLKLIARGYRTDDITAFFKNPLVSRVALSPEINAQEELAEHTEQATKLKPSQAKQQNLVDLADNYLRKTGKRGRRTYTELAEILGIIGVTELEERLKVAKDVRTMSEAVREFTVEAGLEARVEAYAADIEAAGFAREAGECRRYNTAIGELLDRLSVILGDMSCGLEEFRKLLDAGFSDMKGGAIPETMDMVLVGDLKRSRLDDIDMLYILGANDGLLPSAVTGGGIFTDYERIEIMNQGIELAPDDKTDSIIQRFYLKLLLNKPTHGLTISYAGRGSDGKALRASSVISELMRGDYGSFDSIESIELNDTALRRMHTRALDAGLISSEADALMYISKASRMAAEEDEEFFDTYKALRNAGKQEELDKLLQAAFTGYKEDRRLSREAADELYNELLQGSVTRIEGYESCPYSQFARHGLGLKERESYDIRALDIGNIYHGALDTVFKELKARKRELQELGTDELDAIADEASSRIISEYNDNVMGSSARNQYIADKVRKITRRTVRTIKSQLESGDFKTRDTEYEFKLKEDKLLLRGKIDRLDVCEAEGESYVRIIDYKSGNKEFSLKRLINGLDLQLITYMDRALKLIGERAGSRDAAAPAGMFYYHIDDPAIDYKPGITAEGIEKEKTSKLRLSGAVINDGNAPIHMDRSLSADELNDKKALARSEVIGKGSELFDRETFAGLMQYADERIKADTKAILEGDIKVRPYKDGSRTGCDYCPYRSLCGFDVNVDGYRYRHIRNAGLEDIDV